MILLSDGSWDLNEDKKDRGGISHRLNFWLSHQCDSGGGICQRYFSIINAPCLRCGSVCPVALQGMYKMMVYL